MASTHGQSRQFAQSNSGAKNVLAIQGLTQASTNTNSAVQNIAQQLQGEMEAQTWQWVLM